MKHDYDEDLAFQKYELIAIYETKLEQIMSKEKDTKDGEEKVEKFEDVKKQIMKNNVKKDNKIWEKYSPFILKFALAKL
jgi:hypothetical protein